MKRVLWLLILSWIGWPALQARAAEPVDIEACKLTPEPRKELKLTTAQEPQVDQVYSQLAPMQQQLDKAREKRQELRESGGDAEAIEKLTNQIIALENQCREQRNPLLKPILTEEQFARVLEMEALHRKRAQARQAGSTPESR